MEKELILSNELKVEKLQDPEYNIAIRYKNNNIDYVIYTNEIVFKSISLGILNAMVNGMSSYYEFDDVVENNTDMSEEYANSFIKHYSSKFPIKTYKEYKYLFVKHLFTINALENNSLRITISRKVGLLNNVRDNIKYIRTNEPKFINFVPLENAMKVNNF